MGKGGNPHLKKTTKKQGVEWALNRIFSIPELLYLNFGYDMNFKVLLLNFVELLLTCLTKQFCFYKMANLKMWVTSIFPLTPSIVTNVWK